jgi:hypothetical protein
VTFYMQLGRRRHNLHPPLRHLEAAFYVVNTMLHKPAPMGQDVSPGGNSRSGR